MARAFGSCSKCGAPVETSTDGRFVQCHYCGAVEARTVDPARLASSLRADARSVDELFEGLARTLGDEFQELTRVETSGGLFSAKRVTAFEMSLDDAVYRMERGPRGIVAERAEVVRGIAVRTEPLPVDAWLKALSAALSAMAGSSARTRDALRRIARDQPPDR